MQKMGVVVVAVFVSVVFFASVLLAQDEAYEKGRTAYLKKDYKTAVKYLREYVAKNPDPEAYYLLGYANYEVKRKSGPRKGKKDFWGDTETAGYFKEAYLLDPGVSARSIHLEKGSR